MILALYVICDQKTPSNSSFLVVELRRRGVKDMYLIWCKTADFSLTYPLEYINGHILPSSAIPPPPAPLTFLLSRSPPYPLPFSFTLIFILCLPPYQKRAKRWRVGTQDARIEWGFDNRCKLSWKDAAKYETYNLQRSKWQKTVWELAPCTRTVMLDLLSVAYSWKLNSRGFKEAV